MSYLARNVMMPRTGSYGDTPTVTRSPGTTLILKRRIRMQGFIIFQDYGDRYPEFLQAMTPLVEQQKVLYREHMVEGLEHAPQAFIDMLKGKNFGKTVVKVA